MENPGENKTRDELIAYAKGLETCLYRIHDTFYFKSEGGQIRAANFTGNWFEVATQVHFADYLMREFHGRRQTGRNPSRGFGWKALCKWAAILFFLGWILLDTLSYYGIELWR